jgi:serine protease
MKSRSKSTSPLSRPKPSRFRPSLRIEELECRNLMSASLPVADTFDNLQLDTTSYSSENVLVRWESNAPAAAGNANLLDLGSGLYRVTLSPGQSVAEALTYYQGLPGVDYATPDYEVQLARTPNDPSYGSLYGMTKIGAPAAWDVSTGSANMVVAVIDTGVNYTHPDLAANMWRNPREIAGNGLDDDGNGYRDDIFGWDFANNDSNPMDDNGHGTHVAGTIGAVGNNSVGVVGVNWNVKIMALKFLSASGSGNLSNAVLALNYAVANGAKVSNNSYGGGGFFAAMDTAVANARAAGHIFVAAAGNENNNNDVNPSYPAGYNYNNVISVAATDSADRRASFSNYGATSVDIAAPGVSILSTWLGTGYNTISGTSMASPHVAGAAALVWSANPSLSYSQVIDRLYSSADVITGLNGLVAGSRRLNVGRAIGTPTPPTDTTPPTVAALTFNGTTSITSATITFSEAINASTFTAADVRFTAPNGSLIAITGVSGSGTTYTVSFASQTAPGTYTMVVGPSITDLAGNAMTASFTATRAISAPATTTTFTANPNLAIRDNATVTSSMNVTQALTIRDLDVRVNLRHTYDSDLVLTLIAPNGTRILLSNRRGGAGDNYTNTTFSDEATTAITAGTAPFSGTYRAENALTALDGRSSAGTWRLEVRDAAAQDVGTLVSWSLVVTTGGAGTSSLSVGDEIASDGGLVAELDFGPKDSPFQTIFEPVSVVDQPMAAPIAGVSSTPSVTWLTSDSVGESTSNEVGSAFSNDESVEVSISATEEEGIFAFDDTEDAASEEETEIDVPMPEQVGIDLMGVEIE